MVILALVMVAMTGFLLISFSQESDMVVVLPTVGSLLGRKGNQDSTHAAAYVMPELDSPKVKGTIVMFGRNEQIKDVITTVKDMESNFNKRFRYPWTIVSDQTLSKDFRRGVRAAIKQDTQVNYVTVPKSQWKAPESVDSDLRDASFKFYHGEAFDANYNRFMAGFLTKVKQLANYDWYWKVSPGSVVCPKEYDVFQFMALNNRTLGFMDGASCQGGKKSPEDEALREVATEYSLTNKLNDYGSPLPWDCEYGDNEIGRLDFWNSKQYQDFFSSVDRQNGFFYQKWTDRAVRSYGINLLLDDGDLFWFEPCTAT